MNQVVLIIIIKFLAMPTHGFCGGGQKFQFGERICHTIFKDSAVKLTQKKAIPLIAADLINSLKNKPLL